MIEPLSCRTTIPAAIDRFPNKTQTTDVRHSISGEYIKIYLDPQNSNDIEFLNIIAKLIIILFKNKGLKTPSQDQVDRLHSNGTLRFLIKIFKNSHLVTNYAEAFTPSTDELSYLVHPLLFDTKCVEYLTYHGYVLSISTPDLLTRDKGFVLKAVATRMLSYQYVAPELKDDQDVVLAAAKNDYQALRFAADELKLDKNMLLDHIRGTCFKPKDLFRPT